MQKITRKKIIAVVAIAAIVIIVFSMIRSCKKSSEDKYEFEDITIGPVERTISVTGVLEVRDQTKVLSKANGMITKIHTDYNKEVKKGQLLAMMDTTEMDKNLMKMGQTYESLKSELDFAKDELEGKKEMFNEKLISDKGLERAEYNYKTVLFRYKQFMIDYNSAKKMRADMRVTSPLSGVVMSILVSENITVAVTSPLFIIAPTLKNMLLTISIDESDIGMIKPGQKVSFTVSAFPDKTFKGTIDQVRTTPVIKGGLVTYDSTVKCDNSELLLKPGMTATTTIQINKKEKVLRVPNQAFIVTPLETQDPSQKIVWRKTNQLTNKLPMEKVIVETGLRGDSYTEITKNLKKGDKILIKFVQGKK